MRVPFFSAQLELVAKQELEAQHVGREVAAEFWRLHQGWAQHENLSREARSRMFQSIQKRLRKLLGAASYQTYAQRLNKHFEWLLLTPKND